jgi:hypothetical protein
MTATTLRRTDLPVMLPGATQFTDDREVLTPLAVVRLLKQRPEILDDLAKATTVVHEGRKERLAGSWALAFVAFTCSAFVDIEPWWTHSADTNLWEECGFEKRPAYQTVWDRFIELEQRELAFRQAAWKLVQRARKHTDGLVGRDVHIDSTESESNSRFVHDCEPGKCPNKKKRRGKTPERVATSVPREIRQALAEKAPPEDQKALVLGEVAEYEIVRDPVTGKKWLRLKTKSGCYFKSRDVTAGARCYDGVAGGLKYWDGFYNTKAVDHYTGAPIDVIVYNASINEYNTFNRSLSGIEKALGGEKPRAIVTDAGYSIEKIYKKTTTNAIALVAPFRQGKWPHRSRYDTDEYDRHGIPRCKHCGGEGRFVSFTVSPTPRLLFACAVGCTDAKGKRMSINCDKKWRLLVPLWRNTEAYMALRDSHQEYEAVHRYWRQRYRVGGNDFYGRPKRIGAQWQQLRASAALLSEWLKICWREGWLGSARRNMRHPRTREAAAAVQNLVSYRIRLGLDKKSAGQSLKKAGAGAGGTTDSGQPPPGAPPPPASASDDDIPF